MKQGKYAKREKCALCLKKAKLCKSHIIPEFLYKPMYDKNSRFIEVVDVDKGKVARGQKGYWEHLLCASCEDFLNLRFEKDSQSLYVDRLPDPLKEFPWMREHPKLEPARFKLFWLSILWRSSVSTRPVFNHVSLGPHEETIRQMILNEDPGALSSYPVAIAALHLDGNHLRDFLVEPSYTRADGGRYYRFVSCGFAHFIYVSRLKRLGPFEKLIIRPDTAVRTFDMEISETPFLSELWTRVSKNTRDVEI